MPATVVEYRDMSFGGDMRDITISFAKIKRVLGFETALDVDYGRARGAVRAEEPADHRSDSGQV
jgi:hypothetical protein